MSAWEDTRIKYKKDNNLIVMDFPSNAFEVEDIARRENYAFWKKEDKVVLIDTTRTFQPLEDYSHRNHKHTFGPEKFPFGCENAEEYFEYMYNKSLKMDQNIAFLAWIDPETGEQVEEEQD